LRLFQSFFLVKLSRAAKVEQMSDEGRAGMGLLLTGDQDV
jgi:hypothetical protein